MSTVVNLTVLKRRGWFSFSLILNCLVVCLKGLGPEWEVASTRSVCFQYPVDLLLVITLSSSCHSIFKRGPWHKTRFLMCGCETESVLIKASKKRL